MSIPRRIHYCWLSDDPVPDELKRNIVGWKKLLPDYEFVKWDLKRFNKESSVWVKEAIEEKKYAFASDYIRLFAVYHYGGIYLDMDVEVKKSFDELLEEPYMLAYESPNENRIEAGCFGAEQHDPFIKACLDHYEDRHFIGKNGILDIQPLSKVMFDILKENNMNIRLYSWEFFTAKSFATGIESPGENTYAIHHFAGSWKSEKERKTIEKARKLRNTYPIIGKCMAFIYEKTHKMVDIIKHGGLRELGYRIKQYLRR